MNTKDEKVIFVPLKDIATSAKGKKPALLERENRTGYLPYIDIEAFEKGVFKQFTKPEKIVSSDDGDVLMVWDGSRSGLVGRGRKGALGSTLVKIDVPLVEKTYLFHFLEALYPKINSRAKGVGIPHVDPDLLWSSQFPVVSQKQQHLIVEKIEELLSEVEASIKELESAQKKLKLYRASALNAACSGKLVPTEAELAKKEKRSYETGAESLARILKERREKWSGRGKYVEPTDPDTTNLPTLPEGWVWASFDQLLSSMRNGISAKPDVAHGLPILRISAVRSLSVDLKEVRFLNATETDYADYLLSEGDILFTRYNGNPLFVGVCGVVPHQVGPLVYPDKLIRCRLASDLVLPNFVAIMANVGHSRSYLSKRVRTTAGQSGISGGDLKGLPIPLAPISEQRRIVAEAERRLSIVDETEGAISLNLMRANRLRQSILEQAFSGKLVPQDQSDEPASVLLEKIKAEREKEATIKKALPKAPRGRTRIKKA